MARLYKRGRVYYADIFISGRRQRRPLDTDKEIAQHKLGKLIEEKEARRFHRFQKNAGWHEFKCKYFEWCRANKAYGTLNHEQGAIKLLEAFRPISRLNQITPLLLEDLKTDWRNKSKYSPVIINRRIRAIKTIMRRAEAWEYITPQNWRTVGRFKEPKGKLAYFAPDDLKTLLRVCHGPWRTIALLGARAGLRRGEIHTLEWSDVDFMRNRLHIAPKADWSPKDHERRWVPLSKDLRKHLEAEKKKARTQWVISGQHGRETIGSLTTYFRRLVDKAELKGGIHTLRHTFASHLAAAGVPLYSISKLLGHSSVTTTEIYAHLCPETQESAISRLPKIL